MTSTPIPSLFPRVSIQTLATLLAIRDFGTARAAAEKFGKSISAITRQVHELEKELNGVRLCERGPKGLQLTRAGLTYAEAAARAMAELDHARVELGTHEPNLRGCVRVHISEVLVDEYLMPEIHAFSAEFPQTAVEVTISSAERARTALLDHSTDFATMWGLEKHDDIAVVRRARYPLIAVVKHGHKLAKKKKVTPGQILCSGSPVALPPPSYSTRVHFENLLSRSNSNITLEECPSPILSVNSFEHSQRYVNDFNAIAVVPALAACFWIQKGELKRLDIAGASSENTSFALCRHRRHSFTPAAEQLFRRLDRAFMTGIAASEWHA